MLFYIYIQCSISLVTLSCRSRRIRTNEPIIDSAGRRRALVRSVSGRERACHVTSRQKRNMTARGVYGFTAVLCALAAIGGVRFARVSRRDVHGCNGAVFAEAICRTDEPPLCVVVTFGQQIFHTPIDRFRIRPDSRSFRLMSRGFGFSGHSVTNNTYRYSNASTKNVFNLSFFLTQSHLLNDSYYCFFGICD